MHFQFFDAGGRPRCCVVTIAARPIFDQGQPCAALLDPTRAILWLSDQIPKAERRKQLFHELRHYWQMIRGIPAGEEADAIDFSELMDAIWEQYAAQGGDEALEALEPAKDAPIGKPAAMQFATTINCGYCDRQIAIGSVETAPPEWDQAFGQWICDRGVWCDETFGCGQVTVWRELCTADGRPSGQLVAQPPPRVLTSSEAAEWFRNNQRESRPTRVHVAVA